MSGGLYENFLRPLLFRIDPERAHDLALAALRLSNGRFTRGPQRAENRWTLFGVTFPNPVGLAAGFDKNGVALSAWAALGFGFAEIGTITAQPQPGNPRPRIFRLPDEQALINRLGFNNDGADAVAARLQSLRQSGRWPDIPIGINIGKSKATSIERAAEDYLYSLRRLRPFADYIALNVSSPNTQGLRALQERDALESLCAAVGAERAGTPVLLKIAPDLSDAALEEVIGVCERQKIDGIIATNTTVDHSAIPPQLEQTGGLSGAPLRQRATEVIRFIRARTHLPIIGVGGIFDAASAQEKFDAGAQLVQLYTGFVFRGPALLRELRSVAATQRVE